MHTIVRLDTAAITNAPSFHRAFAAAFGFASFYGHNWDAWIDFMSDLRGNHGTTAVVLRPSEAVRIELPDANILRARCPDVLLDLACCAAIVNQRFRAVGQPPAVALVYL